MKSSIHNMVPVLSADMDCPAHYYYHYDYYYCMCVNEST